MPNQGDRSNEIYVRTLDQENEDNRKVKEEKESARIAKIEEAKAMEAASEAARIEAQREEEKLEEILEEIGEIFEERHERNETYDSYNSGGYYLSPIKTIMQRKYFAAVGGRNFIFDIVAGASSTLEELQKIKNTNKSKSFLPDKRVVRKEDRFGNSDNYAERVEGEESRRRLEENKLKEMEKDARGLIKYYKDRLLGNPFNYGYIFIHLTKRNSFVTLTDNKFQLQKVRSAGSLGPVDNSIKYKGKKKNSATAREAVAFAAAGHALEIKRRMFYVIFKARERVNSSYFPFLKGLLKRNLCIEAFRWRNPTAHGYVRYRKKRRI